ncbi:hypothetical protein RDABS01_027192 [Bienertia sinuspersici]
MPNWEEIWGLKSVGTPTESFLKWLTNSFFLDILFLSETKCSHIDMARLFSKLALHNFLVVDALNNSGGLALAWKSSCKLTYIYKCKNVFICSIKDNKTFSIILLLFMLKGPWLLIGEFNQIESLQQKIGGAKSIKGIDAFLEWKNACLVKEVHYTGIQFTWSNNQENEDQVQERLDKAYINEEWETLFPEAKVWNLPRILSNHGPIILETEAQHKKLKRPYKMEAWCLTLQDIQRKINQVWSEHVQGSQMFKLQRKLQHTLLSCKEWCLNYKKTNALDWSKIIKEAELMQLHPERREENTAFFFKSVKQRKAKNEINCLRRKGTDEWITDQAGLKEEIGNFFSHLFQSENEIPEISKEENWLTNLPSLSDTHLGILNRPFSEEEVEKEISSMKPYNGNMPCKLKKLLKKQLGMNCKDRIGNYLGCPMEVDGRSSHLFKELEERIRNKIDSWKFKFLSQAGKIILCNSILVALISHIIFIYLVPKQVTKRITSTMLRFFWSTSENKKPIYAVKRETLEKHKNCGGLGLRNVETLNKAMLCKQAWRLNSRPNLLAAKVINARYGENWLHNATRNHFPKKTTWAMRGILKSVADLKKGFRKEVGDGRKTSIEHDIWVGENKIKTKESPQNQNKPFWRMECFKIWQWFDKQTKMKILTTYIPHQQAEDKLVWKFTNSWEVTTKTAYWQEANQVDSGEDKFWKVLWKLNVFPKWKIFIWKLMHKALPTMHLLVKKGIQADKYCQFCQEEEEN